LRVLVGTKCDCDKQRQVNQVDIDAFARKHGLKYYATSSLTQTNVNEVFDYAIEELLARIAKGRFANLSDINNYMEWKPAEEVDTTTEEGSASLHAEAATLGVLDKKKKKRNSERRKKGNTSKKDDDTSS
jgi:GTPase SAR1 family protein